MKRDTPYTKNVFRPWPHLKCWYIAFESKHATTLTSTNGWSHVAFKHDQPRNDHFTGSWNSPRHFLHETLTAETCTTVLARHCAHRGLSWGPVRWGFCIFSFSGNVSSGIRKYHPTHVSHSYKQVSVYTRVSEPKSRQCAKSREASALAHRRICAAHKSLITCLPACGRGKTTRRGHGRYELHAALHL
jgi:hypothetical protein